MLLGIYYVKEFHVYLYMLLLYMLLSVCEDEDLPNNLLFHAMGIYSFCLSVYSLLARLDEVQEELLYYPGVGVSIGISKMLKFYVKVFYVMGKALKGELSCPCDRSC